MRKASRSKSREPKNHLRLKRPQCLRRSLLSRSPFKLARSMEYLGQPTKWDLMKMMTERRRLKTGTSRTSLICSLKNSLPKAWSPHRHLLPKRRLISLRRSHTRSLNIRTKVPMLWLRRLFRDKVSYGRSKTKPSIRLGTAALLSWKEAAYFSTKMRKRSSKGKLLTSPELTTLVFTMMRTHPSNQSA